MAGLIWANTCVSMLNITVVAQQAKADLKSLVLKFRIPTTQLLDLGVQ